MRRHRGTHFLAAALVALGAIGLAGCEDATRPVAPERIALAPRLTVTVGGPADLGVIVPAAINNLGQVVGFRGTSSGQLPVLWTPSAPGATTGALVDLPLLANGGVDGLPRGINDVGQIAGTAGVATPGYVQHVAIWTTGPTGATITDLGTFGNSGPQGIDVNDAGQVVGTFVTGGQLHAFLWTPSAPGSATGTIVDLGTLGGVVSQAFDINNLGQVVGRARTASGDDHAFLWTPSAPGASTGAMLNLGTLPGGATSYALSVNDFGQVAGFSSTASGDPHAVLWTVSPSGSVTIQDLEVGVGGIGSLAFGINNLGQVAGTVHISHAEAHAFFWAPNEGTTILTALGGCPPAQFGLDFCSHAVGINDLGEVVGQSWTGSTFHGTRWTVRVIPPTPVEQVETIADQVGVLVGDGVLGQGQGNALTAKLDAATKQLNKGHTHAAINLLQAFIKKCEAYVAAGILTAAQAQPLIDAAQDLIDELSGA